MTRGRVRPRRGNNTLEETDIHTILSNRRRQILLSLLDEEGQASLRWLSERIAEIETGESPPPSDHRKSVYVSLKQSHLPLLQDHEMAEFDEQTKTVQAGDNLDEARVYTEIVPKHGLFWTEYYLAVALLGLLTVFASGFGVPVLSTVSPLVLAYLFFAVIVASGIYQLATQHGRTGFDFGPERPDQ